jgi:hypothetical protein
MGHSILVFVSHSSEDKATLIEPLVKDLEDCYINVWLDKRKIVPGDNLRKSIFRDGLDKADVALIFFTENSLKSSWVDREIKHVLRDEHARGNDFDLRKIISIFDSDTTYRAISDRYPELTDDLLHLMPAGYSSVQLGQLISAIWSKYLSLQGGDVATQRQLLEKDREIFRKEQQLAEAISLYTTHWSRNAASVAAATLTSWRPSQIVFTPGSPSLLRPMNPPNRATKRSTSLSVGTRSTGCLVCVNR